MLFVPSGKPSRGDSMPSNRREFLTRAARALGSGALCTSTAAPKDLLATVAWPEELFGKALFAKMKWFNEPASATQSGDQLDRKSTRLNSSHTVISYAVFCLKKKKHEDTSPIKTRSP